MTMARPEENKLKSILTQDMNAEDSAIRVTVAQQLQKITSSKSSLSFSGKNLSGKDVKKLKKQVEDLESDADTNAKADSPFTNLNEGQIIQVQNLLDAILQGPVAKQSIPLKDITAAVNAVTAQAGKHFSKPRNTR